MKEQEYTLYKTIERPNAQITVLKPVLSQEERKARMKQIHSAVADLMNWKE